MLVRLLALTFVLATTVAAQDRMHAEMPLEITDTIGSAEGGVAVSVASAPPQEAPKAQRIIDKKFVAVMAALGGAESLRFTSRKLVLENEFAAGAPWITHVEPNQNLVARYTGIYAAEFAVAYEIKKQHDWLPGDRVIRKFWWAYPAAMAAIHIKNGIANIRTQGPGGCTFIQCAQQMQ
jgi:hypothetical protein